MDMYGTFEHNLQMQIYILGTGVLLQEGSDIVPEENAGRNTAVEVVVI
jgi:hypothetical protein